MRTFISPLVVALVLGVGFGVADIPASSAAAGSNPSTKVLVGAGSTFVYPLVSQWSGDYNKKAGVTVTYGAIGSGGGIQSISNRSVDFGASDAPLTPSQMRSCRGCLELPWVLGATAVTYNVKGAPMHLKLDGRTLALIFLGQIKSWNAPAIAELNPGAKLPSTQIRPVFRSDSSGTSYNFTDYLSSVSPAFKAKVGTSTQPTFPTGEGAKGSSGVAGVIARTDGAIGYVDVAYAVSSHLQYAAVKNRAGTFVQPSVASTEAAAAAAASPRPNQGISIVDPPPSASKAYPIATFSYVIVPRRSPKAAALRKFVSYALTSGQTFGPKLLFAPLPSRVTRAAKQALDGID